MIKTWNEKEVELLKQYLAEGMSNANIARQLGRSIHSVQSKIHRLGLSSGYDLWSDDEINLLCKLAEEGRSLDYIASKIGRTPNAINIKLSKLNIYRKCKFCKFSEEDIASIRNDWIDDKLSTKHIANKYNRSESSIRVLAVKNDFGARTVTDKLSIKDLVDYMHIPRYKIKTWFKMGLPYKVARNGARKYLIKSDDLLAFLEDHQDTFNASLVDDCLFIREPDWFKKKRVTDRVKRVITNNHKEYTNAEDKSIIWLYQQGLSYETIAIKFNRTPTAIKRRLNILYAGYAHPKYYKDDELTIIRDNAPYVTVDELCAMLGNKRSAKSVMKKCDDLGVEYHLVADRCKKR